MPISTVQTDAVVEQRPALLGGPPAVRRRDGAGRPVHLADHHGGGRAGRAGRAALRPDVRLRRHQAVRGRVRRVAGRGLRPGAQHRHGLHPGGAVRPGRPRRGRGGVPEHDLLGVVRAGAVARRHGPLRRHRGRHAVHRPRGPGASADAAHQGRGGRPLLRAPRRHGRGARDHRAARHPGAGGRLACPRRALPRSQGRYLRLRGGDVGDERQGAAGRGGRRDGDRGPRHVRARPRLGALLARPAGAHRSRAGP